MHRLNQPSAPSSSVAGASSGHGMAALGHPRSVHGCALLLALLCGLAACAEDERPAFEQMSLRELLGLSPQVLVELDTEERAHFVKSLDQAWRRQLEESYPTIVDQERMFDAVIALDQQRGERGLDPLLRCEWRNDGSMAAASEVGSIAASPEALGISLSQTLEVRPLSGLDPFFFGDFHLAEGWNAVASERDRMALLEPALRRELFALGLREQPVTLERAPQAPFAWCFVPESSTLVLNPNILYLLSTPPLAAEAGFGGSPTSPDNALVPDFIQSCVAELRLRCQDCAATPPRGECLPLMHSEAQSLQAALDECSAFSAEQNEGFYLFCFNSYLDSNLGCFYATIDAQRCGAEAAPYQYLHELVRLRPFLSDASCEAALTGCQQSRVGELLPEDRPVYVNHDDDDDDEWCSDCAGVACDFGSICASVDCGDESSGCEGDDAGALCDGASLCEGDATAASTGSPFELVFVPPFALLLGLYAFGRRPR